MPFTPKFVDLVREQHDGAGHRRGDRWGQRVGASPGSPRVSRPGDQFYYCIQGVDKPAEREVGRGTLQADGTIAREAMRALRRLYQRHQDDRADRGGGMVHQDRAGAGGIGRGERDELGGAGRGQRSDGACLVLVEVGREGLFLFDAPIGRRRQRTIRPGNPYRPGVGPERSVGCVGAAIFRRGRRTVVRREGRRHERRS